MFTEGFLSTIVICGIAGFGYTALKNGHAAQVAADAAKAAAAGAAFTAPAFALTLDNWGALFTKVSESLKLSRPTWSSRPTPTWWRQASSASFRRRS